MNIMGNKFFAGAGRTLNKDRCARRGRDLDQPPDIAHCRRLANKFVRAHLKSHHLYLSATRLPVKTRRKCQKIEQKNDTIGTGCQKNETGFDTWQNI